MDDVIVCEAPLVLGPRHHDAVPASCPGCLRALSPNEDIRCPQCMWPACSESCEGLRDNSRHGAECKLLRALAIALKGCRSEVLLPLRCLLLQKRNPQKWKLLEQMEHHLDAKEEDSQSKDLINFLENAILKPLNDSAPGILPDCSSKTVKRIFALLDVNALELTAPHAGPLAALYTVTSLLEHSCLPNTRLSFEAPPEPGEEKSGKREWRGRVTVRAARNIKKGEHLSTMYTHALWSTMARQEHLMAIKNFRCSCARCLDPRELGTDIGTLKCVACPGLILPVQPAKIEKSEWKCNGGCGASLTAQEVRTLVDCLASEVERVTDRREQHPTVQKLEELLEKLQTLLHPHHQHCLTVQHLLLQAYGAEPGKGGITALKDAELERKAALSRDMMSVILQLDPPLARVGLYAAVCFLELERADVEIMKRRFASGAYNTDHVTKAISDCRALLRRVLHVLRSEPKGSPGARVAALAEEDDVALVSWATKKGIKLAEE